MIRNDVDFTKPEYAEVNTIITLAFIAREEGSTTLTQVGEVGEPGVYCQKHFNELVKETQMDLKTVIDIIAVFYHWQSITPCCQVCYQEYQGGIYGETEGPDTPRETRTVG